jgi:hypothetical protein
VAREREGGGERERERRGGERERESVNYGDLFLIIMS